MKKLLILDAHEDLAWNALCFGRDYTLSAAEIRTKEKGGPIPGINGEATIGWQDFKEGNVGIVFATLFGSPPTTNLGDVDKLHYENRDEAHAVYWQCLEYYHDLTEKHPEKFRLILSRSGLDQLLSEPEESRPVGIVILMEGAEGIRSVDELQKWWDGGLRIIGPAWTGTCFCGGTGVPGGLTQEGRALLEGMSKYGFILDLTHMDSRAARESLELYDGPIIASHSNANTITKSETNRQLPDDVIEGIAKRGGVMGMVMFNNFLDASWEPSEGILFDTENGSPKDAVTLEHIADHCDYIAELTGSKECIGIGTDFDGGFGRASIPKEIDTIADLQKLIPVLAKRGYTEAEIERVMSGNFLRVLSRALP